MAIYLQQQLFLELYGDGTSISFSYDLSKPPVSSDPIYSSQEGLFVVGTPTQVEANVEWEGGPQIGIDGNGSAIYDEPMTTTSLVGTVLTLTFAIALKQFGSTFTDAN